MVRDTTAYGANDLALATPAAQWALVFDRDDGIIKRVKIRLSENAGNVAPTEAHVEWPSAA